LQAVPKQGLPPQWLSAALLARLWQRKIDAAAP
jgi:hypothetical protein